MRERYLLRIGGPIGPLLRITIGDVHYRTVPCQTTITGALSDDGLRNLLSRLDDYGVEVVHLERRSLPTDETRASSLVAGWPEP